MVRSCEGGVCLLRGGDGRELMSASGRMVAGLPFLCTLRALGELD